MLCNLYVDKIHERCDTLVVHGNSAAPQDVVLPEKMNLTRGTPMSTPLDLSQTTVNRLDRETFTVVTIFIPASDESGFFRVRVD